MAEPRTRSRKPSLFAFIFGSSTDDSSIDDSSTHEAGSNTSIDAAIRELLATEKAYVNRLDILMNCFKVPFEAWCREAQDDDVLSQILDEITPRTLFSNIDEILRVNTFLLEALEKVSSDDKTAKNAQKKVSAITTSSSSANTVADVFISMAPFLLQYVSYYVNYNESTDVLERLTEQSRDFRVFIRACELQVKCGGERIASLLIQPVQRIPRYKLLLETVKSRTSDGADKIKLTEAIERVGNVLTRLNDEIAQKENRAQVVEINQKFVEDTGMIAPHRRLIKEGQLIKMSQAWGFSQVRYVVLFNDVLIYGKRSFNSKVFGNREISLHQCIVIDSEADEPYFLILIPDRSLYLMADTPSEKTLWIEGFRRSFIDINSKHECNSSDSTELSFDPNGRAYVKDGTLIGDNGSQSTRLAFNVSSMRFSPNESPNDTTSTRSKSSAWLPRKITACLADGDGNVSSHNFVLPDTIIRSIRGIFTMDELMILGTSSALAQVTMMPANALNNISRRIFDSGIERDLPWAIPRSSSKNHEQTGNGQTFARSPSPARLQHNGEGSSKPVAKDTQPPKRAPSPGRLISSPIVTKTDPPELIIRRQPSKLDPSSAATESKMAKPTPDLRPSSKPLEGSLYHGKVIPPPPK